MPSGDAAGVAYKLGGLCEGGLARGDILETAEETNDCLHESNVALGAFVQGLGYDMDEEGGEGCKRVVEDEPEGK